MKIFTYHADIGRDQASLPLVYLWRERWLRQGWEPVILSEADARRHPAFPELATAFDRLPTINGKPYEFACYARWLAMEVAGGGWMSDSDVIPYDFKPRPPTEKFKLWAGYGNPCPCLCSGTALDYGMFARIFANWEPTSQDMQHRGGSHCSDQNILQQLVDRGLYDRGTECVQYLDPGWDKAPVVHYPGGVMADKQPKFNWIPRLR